MIQMKKANIVEILAWNVAFKKASAGEAERLVCTICGAARCKI